MALYNPVNPKDLVAKEFFAPESKFNLLGAVQGVVEKGRADANSQRQRQAFSEGSQAAFEGTATPQQISALFASDPEKAKAVMAGAGAFNLSSAKRVAETAFRIQSAPFAQRAGMIQQAAQRVQQSGGDPNRILSLLNMSEQQQNEQLNVFQQAALSVKERADQGMAEKKFGLDERRTASQERNVNSQISDRNRRTAIAAGKGPKKTTIQQNLELAGLVEGTPDFQKAVMAYIKKPVGTTVTIGDSKTMAKATEGQLAAAGFADRLANSNQTLKDIEGGDFDPSSLTQKIGTSVIGGNFILDDDGQLYQAAKEDFITAVLRKESGAAIGKDEFVREDKKYFPQIGDSKKTIKAKRDRRERQMNIQDKQSKGVYDIQYEKPTSSIADESKKTGGVLQEDAQGNRAIVYPDGTFKELP